MSVNPRLVLEKVLNQLGDLNGLSYNFGPLWPKAY